MNDAQIWWYITRASALIAWVLLTLSALWGVLLATRVLRKIDNPAWLQDLHRYLGGLTLFMVLLHMGSLMLDGWLQFTWAETLVPFATDFKPIATALGIISFYLIAVVQITSWLMKRLPRALWKGIHYSSYVVLFFVALHAGWVGTDVSTWWYRILAIVLIALAAIAALIRILIGRNAKKASARPSAVASAQNVVEPPVSKDTITMVVASASMIAEKVLALRLVPLGGVSLPVWQPGAHITVYLPNGLQRQYSLCGDPADRQHFDIAVLESPTSEGGSSWIHSQLRPGTTLEVSAPRNHFELEPAPEYVFIAGGIGITPIKAMIESLPPQRTWHLHYVGKSVHAMAFASELTERYPGNVTTYVSTGKGKKLNLDSVLAAHATAEVYCCGPEPLMQAVAEIVPEQRLHLERFVPLVRHSDQPDAPIEVTCRKSKKTFVVAADESILSEMEKQGIPILGSCNKGVCGTCEVRVLDGIPLHLDSVMDDADKDALGVMYPCVSRAQTPNLTLDI